MRDQRRSGFVSRDRYVGWLMKTQTEEVNQRSDLNLFVSLLMSGACLSSKEERVVLIVSLAIYNQPAQRFWRICYETR